MSDDIEDKTHRRLRGETDNICATRSLSYDLDPPSIKMEFDDDDIPVCITPRKLNSLDGSTENQG